MFEDVKVKELGIKWYNLLNMLESFKITIMTIAFQSSMFALIAISILLVIGVRVALAFPNGWSSKKNVLFLGVSLWIGLVFLVGPPPIPTHVIWAPPL